MTHQLLICQVQGSSCDDKPQHFLCLGSACAGNQERPPDEETQSSAGHLQVRISGYLWGISSMWSSGPTMTRRENAMDIPYMLSILTNQMINSRDFPGGTAVKNPPANAGNMGLIPGPGRSHMPQSS